MNDNEDHRNNVVVLASTTTAIVIATAATYLMLDNPREPYSNKDCLGALDETHIIASVPEKETIKFRSGRSNKITQNILVACSFNLRFTYIIVGWEGTVQDRKKLDDGQHRLNAFVIPHDQYYLADPAFTLEPGVLPPFCNTRYHLNEKKRVQTC
ncbi:hypothetical protein GIB67_009224 [Kingdonia uniflora]|uniref:DDE Tnp4 domain-containing protein n=1 Tax=Kingdonia uniflora TaxID=39325 RepID=A0A7J7N2J2_9MAGN|nr:hypothetical protein GIB67_009224 [Kingdonia uniflora]